MDNEIKTLWKEGLSESSMQEIQEAIDDVGSLESPAYLKSRIQGHVWEQQQAVSWIRRSVLLAVPVCTAMLAVYLAMPLQQQRTTEMAMVDDDLYLEQSDFEDIDTLQFYDDEFVLLEEVL